MNTEMSHDENKTVDIDPIDNQESSHDSAEDVDDISMKAVYATSENDVALINELIASGLDVNQLDAEMSNNTLLHIAAIHGSDDVAKLLLEKGANVNARNQDGYAPIHFALRNENDSTAQIFLDHGADVNQSDKHGNTVLHYAVQHKLVDFAYNLIDRGANANQCNYDGMLPSDFDHDQKKDGGSLLNTLSEHAKGGVSDNVNVAEKNNASER